jgi:glycosyltransferase involved in cell wall biosynthesis
MADKFIVFHIPEPLDLAQDSAARLRPNRMVQAFRAQGYEVDIVAGRARERQAAIRKIKQAVNEGRKYEFLYSESTTSPTLLSEPHHLPLYPFLDFAFLNWFKKNVGPTGLFYRDCYWRYPQYVEQIGWLKALVGKTFHWIDLILYRFTLSHIFLPSMKMTKEIPRILRPREVTALPPGTDLKAKSAIERSRRVRLLFVGGIKAPYYDLKPLFRLAEQLNSECEVTVCCRKEEWEEERLRYGRLSENIRIVHASGKSLEALFSDADIFAMLRTPNPYQSFMVPFKIYESLSYGVPIICFPHEGVADDVEKRGWGWVVRDEKRAVSVLEELKIDRSELDRMREHILESARNETWESRAQTVARLLRPT